MSEEKNVALNAQTIVGDEKIKIKGVKVLDGKQKYIAVNVNKEKINELKPQHDINKKGKNVVIEQDGREQDDGNQPVI